MPVQTCVAHVNVICVALSQGWTDHTFRSHGKRNVLDLFLRRLGEARKHTLGDAMTARHRRVAIPTLATLRDVVRRRLGESPLRGHARRTFLWLAERRGISANVDGITMRYVIGSEPIEREPSRTDWVNYADYVMSRAFLRALKPGSVVADVGSFRGGYAVLAAGAAGAGGSVVAFEPSLANHAAIRRNIELNRLHDRVTLCAKAVSDRVGTVSFYAAGGASENSLYRAGVGTSGRAPREVAMTTVETIDLDGYFRGLRDPDVIKIDAEGAEFAVLRGAERILAAGATVICEFHPYAWAQAGHDQDELVAWLAERGRSIIDLRTAQLATGQLAYGPYLLESGSAPA